MDQHKYEQSNTSGSGSGSGSSGLPDSLPSSDSTVFQNDSSGVLLKEFRKYVLNNVLDTKHGCAPSLDVLKVLSKPCNVSKINKYLPSVQQRLLKQFISLEYYRPGFIRSLMLKYQKAAARKKYLPDSHEYGFANNLQLGEFLVKAGWYAEARLILQVALKQAGWRPIQLLQVHSVILLAETFSSLHYEALRTIRKIIQLTKLKEMPDDVRILAHSALSTSYFESSCFEASQREALMALQLVDVQNSTGEVIVDTLRLLGRSCVALGQTMQAKLLLTQALSWSSRLLGKTSLSYAETLEDYAFYLLMMNSLEGCQVAIAEAKYVYQVLYGTLSLRPELAQGNLAFRSFLECYEYRNVLPPNECVKLAFDLGSKREDTEDRQILAIKRVPALIAAANRCNEEEPSGDEQKDVFEEIHSLVSIEDIRAMFIEFFVARYKK